MSTRSTIVLFDLSIEKGSDKSLHIFYDLDGVHITVEPIAGGYDYLVDIHLTEQEWKELKRQMIAHKEFTQ